MKLILEIFFCSNFLIKAGQIFPQCSLPGEPSERPDQSLTEFSLTFEIRRRTNLPSQGRTRRHGSTETLHSFSAFNKLLFSSRNPESTGPGIFSLSGTAKDQIRALPLIHSIVFFIISTQDKIPIGCERYCLSASYLILILILTVLLVVYGE